MNIDKSKEVLHNMIDGLSDINLLNYLVTIISSIISREIGKDE